MIIFQGLIRNINDTKSKTKEILNIISKKEEENLNILDRKKIKNKKNKKRKEKSFTIAFYEVSYFEIIV